MWFKALLVSAIGVFTAPVLLAQSHNNLWFRGTLSVPIGQRFKIDNEFQHRRQNGFGNENMFDKTLMFTYRNWVQYKHSEDVKFSISPFAYFSNYKIIQKEADETARPTSEIRFSAAIDLKHQLFNKLYLFDRTAIEYRIFENNPMNVIRFRTRLGFRYAFTNKVSLSVYEELLVNFSGVTQYHFFDHDRLGMDIEYKVLPNLKLDFGYMHIKRLPLSGVEKLNEHTIFLNVTYQVRKHPKS